MKNKPSLWVVVYLLNGCQGWWEDIDDVTFELPTPSDPLCPCTKIHLCYLDSRLRFPLSQLWKEILTHFHIGLCNLTSTSVRIISCFDRLNEWYHVELGLSEYRVLYQLRKSTGTCYFFQSRSTLRWPAYITELSGHDKDWYRDILLVKGTRRAIYLSRESLVSSEVTFYAKWMIRILAGVVLNLLIVPSKPFLLCTRVGSGLVCQRESARERRHHQPLL